ncbi:PA2169 family four-helix-bundle protein [Aequorivita sp. H23M31]|uniref:PA2169 family four-helix-bundle protein n=1 Tax=Aequorivita ciconiae TaxID=2494375 RepID=A0A410G6A1_9FLAO|nr:PA2169 family four-helix-bundle protein [Aequorivita sp. H23M31]QAA82793.1 PA2169 family four-helix-bundle protein [Aequorivita sp. H23M31]
MKTKEEVSDKVSELIEKNIDSYNGFVKASEKAQDMPLRDYLIDQAEERKFFAADLSNELKNYNSEIEIDTQGTLSASFRQSWLDIKALLGGNSDKSILEECIRADRASADEYAKFIKDYSSASPEIVSLIEKQSQRIVNNLDNQARLKDILS